MVDGSPPADESGPLAPGGPSLCEENRRGFTFLARVQILPELDQYLQVIILNFVHFLRVAELGGGRTHLGSHHWPLGVGHSYHWPRADHPVPPPPAARGF